MALLDNINEFGRFDELKNSVDEAKAKAYFERLEQGTLPPFKVKMKTHALLKDFIIKGGIDIEQMLRWMYKAYENNN